MKKLSILLSTLLIGGIITFVSCTKTGDQGPAGQNGANGANGATGPSGPILYGTITGNVIMSNQYGATLTAYTGGYILLKNAATNARVDSVIPNSSTGVFTIDSVATGTYNLYCVYPGFGLGLTQGVRFTGGTLQVDTKIAAIPVVSFTSSVDSFGTTKRNNNLVYVSGTVAADPNGARTILVFAGSTTTVSSAPATYNFLAPAAIVDADSTKFSIAIPLNTIYTAGFTYGNPIYFSLYGAANNYGYGAYVDYTTGRNVYTAISPTGLTVAPVLTLP